MSSHHQGGALPAACQLPAPASAFEFQSRVDIWTKWRQCNKAFLSGNVKLEPGSSSSDSSPIPKCHYSLLWSFYETLCSLTILLSVYLVYLAETAMAPHSSTLARKTPWTEEPGGLQSMGLRRVGHDWATSLSLFTFLHWRRNWHPPPVFLPGESQGRGRLVGCRLWGRTDSDTTEAT